MNDSDPRIQYPSKWDTRQIEIYKERKRQDIYGYLISGITVFIIILILSVTCPNQFPNHPDNPRNQETQNDKN